jgi:hypothetical protein
VCTREDNILDLVLVNEPITLTEVSVCTPFANSDHCQINFSIALDCNHCPETVRHCEPYTIYAWESADYASMSNYMNSINWQNILSTHLSPNSLWTAFMAILWDAIRQFVPSKQVEPKSKSSHCRKSYSQKIRNVLARKGAYGASTRATQVI